MSTQVEVHHSEDLILEPITLSDVKCNASKLDLELHPVCEPDGNQVKYFSAAMGVNGATAKRKRESSTSSLSQHKHLVNNWRHALMKARTHSDCWEQFHLEDCPTEKALRHRYNALKKEWVIDEVQVKMQSQPFAHGAMRECYRIKKLSNFSHNQDWRRECNNAVAKRFITPVPRNVYFDEVKIQMDAKLWGEEFNRHHPPKQVDFFQMGVLEFIDRPEKPLFHVENYIEGNYVKYNSNSGFVLENEAQRQTPQAFSHFTFEQSGHEIMVVDIQGVGDLYTDPQIHTVAGTEYGEGNLGTRGMALFFHSHLCNSICTNLGLTPFDLAKSEIDFAVANKPKLVEAGTVARGNEEVVVFPSQYQRTHLHEFLRMRSSASTGSTHSLTESIGEWTAADVAEDEETNDSDNGILVRARLSSAGEKCLTPESPISPLTSSSDSIPRRRLRLWSEAGSGTITDEAERLAFRQHIVKNARSSCVVAEVEARKKLLETDEDGQVDADRLRQRTGGSVLGQIHLDLAKYHEMQRFTKPDSSGYDQEAALFHLRHAADCGNLQAIINVARIYLQLPHDILTDLTIEESTENTDIGMDYMLSAAAAGDRAAMVYVAKAYDTGNGLGSRAVSWTEAAYWYNEAVEAVDGEDEEGNYDSTMDDPQYVLFARLGEMHRDGGNGLNQDYSAAADFFSRAAEAAMSAMKGRIANKYYALAEEMNELAS